MKISTKGRYGLRAMIDLAVNGSSDEFTALSAIAKRQDLSVRYLESIFAALKRANLVIGSAGSQGGYMLALPPREITVEMILRCLEGNMSVMGSQPKPSENHSIRAFLKENVWDVIDGRVLSVLKGTTLLDLVAEFQNKTLANESSCL